MVNGAAKVYDQQIWKRENGTGFGVTFHDTKKVINGRTWAGRERMGNIFYPYGYNHN